jgi:DNA-directed RNA polymerase specialized sigma24 family protein
MSQMSVVREERRLDPKVNAAVMTLCLRAREEGPDSDVGRFHDALQRLSRFDAAMARLVEKLYLEGKTIEQTALELGMPQGQVVLEWMLARAWMRTELSESVPDFSA